MKSITLCRLMPDEWRRGRAIRLRALGDSPDSFGATLEDEQEFSETDWINRLDRPDVATFVATSEGGIDFGLVTGAPFDDCLGLFSMWVAPEARGKGVGGMLVEAVIEWAIQQGHSQILLDVGDDNAPAIALYASKGFLPTGIPSTLPPPREHIREHQRALSLRSR